MVVIKPIGGLGNQMFQYAVGRHLAHLLGTELKLDISGYENCNLRKYELGSFNIVENFASPREVKTLTSQKNGALARLVQCLLRRPKDRAPSHIRESYFHFDSEILNLPNNVYLDGYWQSEKYFNNIEDVIRKEFAITVLQTGKNQKMAELISSRESVSLHVRREDYVSNLHTSKVHGTCGLDYYARAIAEIYSRVDSPHFFVFSDDVEWSKANLDISHPVVFVDHNNALRSYEDLRLMSQCRHHIIANSSFSWWGAWLNPDSDKTVIAPDRWFNKEDIDTTDLLPESWIKL